MLLFINTIRYNILILREPSNVQTDPFRFNNKQTNKYNRKKEENNITRT